MGRKPFGNGQKIVISFCCRSLPFLPDILLIPELYQNYKNRTTHSKIQERENRLLSNPVFFLWKLENSLEWGKFVAELHSRRKGWKRILFSCSALRNLFPFSGKFFGCGRKTWKRSKVGKSTKSKFMLARFGDFFRVFGRFLKILKRKKSFSL